MARHSCHAVRCAALALLPSRAVEYGITCRPNEVPMSSFSFATTARILCETGAASRLAQLCRERDAQRVLIVSEPGITRLGLLNDALPYFVDHGMHVEVLDLVLADPPEKKLLAAISCVDRPRGQRRRLIPVSTPAGTGSDLAPNAIIFTGGSPKCGRGPPSPLPDPAVLYAQLTLRLPSAGSAASGIDAMVHAIE